MDAYKKIFIDASSQLFSKKNKEKIEETVKSLNTKYDQFKAAKVKEILPNNVALDQQKLK